MPPKQDDLSKEVRHLADLIRVRGTFKRRFFDGLIFGLGSAIGATLVAGIVLYILSQVFEATGLIEFIGNLPTSE
ncbi:hypothetical protein CO174_04030 [Candidatus Uhrbacteria bacterium CG_4_9_14_3_um_filter_50_9]|uniref:Uncharacterized protein n=1 Tax=Candidatus Uhrbacteria bacterium CG_4_9_14_3_um_filter_50_9 TaxID=1975035 RepID=A0A2M7XBI7_9BACT|nr:MAG: hypothetical protein CO174_04030 [Candidatus Uhrbacteria bacterium CG_4_9_14_3_um_filter_50_9]